MVVFNFASYNTILRMYTLSLMIVSGLCLESIINNSIVYNNAVLLVALPFLGFALHWLRCKTRHPFKYFNPRAIQEQATRTYRIIEDGLWKNVLSFAEDFFVLIVMLIIVVSLVASKFVKFEQGLFSTLYWTIVFVNISFCVILLLELLLSIGIDGLFAFKLLTTLLQILGPLQTAIGFVYNNALFNQLFYWWTFKLVSSLLAIALAYSGAAVNFMISKLFAQLLPIFPLKVNFNNEYPFVTLLLHEEVMHSEALSGQNSNFSLPFRTQSNLIDFFVHFSLAISISSLLSLLGFCIAASRLSSVILQALLCVVYWRVVPKANNQVLDRSAQGIHTFIVSYNVNLVNLKIETRVFLIPIFVLDFWSMILHSAVQIVSDALHKLPASISRNLLANCRILALALLLVALPPFLINHIFEIYNYQISTGLLIFSVSCFYVTIEAVQAILIYALLIIDTFLRPIESLDEWLLGIRFTTGAIDFSIALVSIGFNLSSMASYDWSYFFLIIICLEFYFHVWLGLKSAWKVFQQRRDASRIINSLAIVKASDLNRIHEICAICQLDLLSVSASGTSGIEPARESNQIVTNVKKTSCGHYFHISTNPFHYILRVNIL